MGQSRPDDSREGAEMLTHASLHAGRAVLVAVVVVACAMGGQESKRSAAPDSKQPGREKASGVILKVERAAGGDAAKKSSWTMSLNTDVVWCDFVARPGRRSAEGRQDGTAKAAAKGRDSVATKGHPKSDPLLITVDIDPQTEITVRYRSSTDAIGEGATRPEGAVPRPRRPTRGTGRPKTSSPTSRPGTGRGTPKPRTLEPMELKPGLWVDVEFREEGGQQRARRVMVMRPVGGPDTSPEKERRSPTKSTAPGR